MKGRNGLWIILLAAVCLLLAACADPMAQVPSVPVRDDVVENVVVDASFRREDGGSLSHSSVQISVDGDRTVYPLNATGELWLPGFPQEGEAALALLDQSPRALGDINLIFTTGAVVDASTDNAGTGHIMLREDMQVLGLSFTLGRDGSLYCSLRLAQSNPS